MTRRFLSAFSFCFVAILMMISAGGGGLASPQPESIEILAKQLWATGAPSVAHAMEQMARDGSHPEAAALAAFALGYWSFQNEEDAAAAKWLSQPNMKDLAIADYAAYYLARSRHRLKNYDAALAALEEFSDRFPHSILIPDAVQESCRIWMDYGAAGQCVKFLEEQADFERTPKFLLTAASASEQAGEWSAAAGYLERIAFDFPLSPEATDADDSLREIQRRHPSAVRTPDPEVVRARGEVYFSQNRYRDALSDFQSVAKSYSGTSDEARRSRMAFTELRIGECFSHLKQNRQALAALRQATPLGPEQEAEKAYYRVEVERRLSSDSPDELEQAVAELEKRYPSSPWTEAAIFSLGNYFLVHQDRPRGTVQFEKILKEFPDGKNAAEALFRVGWSAYVRHDFEEARSDFQKFIQRYADSSRTVAAVYWMGRMAEENTAAGGQEAPAAAYYRAVIHDFGESAYAQSARERLSKLAVSSGGADAAVSLPELKPVFSLNDGPVSDPKMVESLRRAGVLMRLSISDLAAREYRAVVGRGRSVRATTQLARIYLSKQDYGAAMVTVRQAFPEYYRASTDQLPMEYWKALFPLPDWPIIRQEAERKGLDPYLVASLIRQESAFNPAARSRANALGLMQLLPRVARRYARKERIPRWSSRKIYDPEINICLGVAYLADTLSRYDGHLEWALAAYNAGDDRVEAWVNEQSQSGATNDRMEFVESIPFTETREYVQILLRNLSYYKKIYGE